MKEVNKSDDNFPIVLEKMTFNVFYHYMSTKKSKKPGGYLYATSYGGVKNSLTHLYGISGKTMSGEFKREISQFMLGTKRVVTANKREYGAIIDEGKKAMVSEVYKI